MAKSVTKINKQIIKKTDPILVETILACKKNKAWKKIAEFLSSPRSKRQVLNLDEINKETKPGETVVVPGKVLSRGKIDKKIKIVAFKFSEGAIEKILESKSEISEILDEVKKNPTAKGLKILTIK